MVATGPPFRLLPRLSDENRFFWTAGAEGVLQFLRCNACQFIIHPPGPVCRRCLSRDIAPASVSGKGRVETFSVNYQQWIPGSEPYIIAWVSIVEQPDVRLTVNLIDVEPDDVRIGMEVEVTFEHNDDVYIPLFRPVGTRPGA
ncbi:MAG TPA: OB-fold domain-containing protein [Acidimicrobiales bacterium]|nr:OB-fold domain-containing protein [Acidimicrobiales bacterium]